jgi:ATP-dependent Lon protease
LQLPIRNDLAMTGEITLRGRVLPIGGLTEKLLAARRGNIKTVLIPKENERELSEVPARIVKSLEIILVENVDEVFEKALVLPEGDRLFKNLPPVGSFCADMMDDAINVRH